MAENAGERVTEAARAPAPEEPSRIKILIGILGLASAVIGLITAILQLRGAAGDGNWLAWLCAEDSDELRSGIRVAVATYGANCGLPEGNATEAIAAHCNGSRECTFRITRGRVPAVPTECRGEYLVKWGCDGQLATRESWIPREAAEKPVSLTCPASSKPAGADRSAPHAGQAALADLDARHARRARPH